MGYLRVTMGHHRVTIGHLRVTVGHLRATMGRVAQIKKVVVFMAYFLLSDH